MTYNTNNLKISSPEYYHREYKNDLPDKESGNYYLDQCKRLTLVALPFISLYKPLSFPLSLILGGLRSFTSISHFLSDIQNGSLKENSYAAFQALISVIALFGTILAHPLGMLITTVHDCAIDSFSIGKHLFKGDFIGALGSSANLLNNTLYLALFLHGGLEIAIASLAMQILLGLSHSIGEFKKGNYLEASGHLLMGMIRGNQMMGQVQVLQRKWKIENLLKQAKNPLKANGESENINIVSSTPTKEESSTTKFNNALPENLSNNRELSEVLAKYGSEPMSNATSHGDIDAVQILIKNNFGFETNTTNLSPLNIAIHKGHTVIAELLIDSGHPLDADGGGFGKIAPIFFAIQYENKQILNHLIKKGANINVKCPINYNFKIFSRMTGGVIVDNKTPLGCIASISSHGDSVLEKYKKEMIEFLLDHGGKL